MRIVFAGTPEAAVPTLEALLSSRHTVSGVITRPPARAGRGRVLVPSPVAEVARAADVPLLEASHLRSPEAAEFVEGAGADLGVVVAYGGLVPTRILEAPRLGWINLHFSDLPRWRGAAPVQWAIREGDSATASCVFQLEEGLDTGPVFSRIRTPIGREDAGELLSRMSREGATQVLDVVEDLEQGTALAVAQDPFAEVTRARMLTHEDGFIDFTEDADHVDRVIRSVTPNPGAWTRLPDGRRMKLRAVTPLAQDTPGPGLLLVSKNDVLVGCAQGCVRLGEVAPAGKSWMGAAAWARGSRPGPEDRLGARTDEEGRI
ncbi:methionyl-tRNA formyltransferase [Schaalia sp. 19OD2882]|uniref:methionyl-tRNA formyltransferase n=1 Tax=Schaalia sp. 19OD2882 TaxID=2794089 RepID=UPI001C1F19F0|nr:methionyl-tRNA formyltransferase [Schaalia sp. 19OD2882]QWW18693.1 methionyl-tRNA formyltransferase [Schaalia sp. 19OD2882]